MNENCILIEVGPAQITAFSEGRVLEMALERTPAGGLSDACRAAVVGQLQGWVRSMASPAPREALCALPARGVSLRRFSIPRTGAREQLIRLRVEAEFPIPIEELAWGWIPCPTGRPGGGSAAAGQEEVLVIALKREVAHELEGLLASCQIKASFTIAAMARGALVDPGAGARGLVHVGRHTTEVLGFAQGIPASLRSVAWGSAGSGTPGVESPLPAPILDKVVASLRSQGTLETVWVTADDPQLRGVAAQLQQAIGGSTPCRWLDPAAAQQGTTAIHGMKIARERNLALPVLAAGEAMAASASTTAGGAGARLPVKALALAAGLLAAVLLFPYAEAMALKPRLARRLASIKNEQDRLAMIDRQYEFLQHLRQSQPPYVDATYLIAEAAPQGCRIENITMNRRGEVALRGSMRDATQVVEFRSKLIGSGFFSSVVVEEQNPTPDRQKLNVRMSAQWKAAVDRETLQLGPAPAQTNSPGTPTPPTTSTSTSPSTPTPVAGAAPATGSRREEPPTKAGTKATNATPATKG